MMTKEGCAVCGTEDTGRFDPDQSPDICIDCLYGGAVDCRIEAHEREGGLRSIQPMLAPAAELREILRDMATLVRVARGEGSAADFERLGIEPDADPMDAALEWVDSWALDVQASESRKTFLLAAGGPHVELDVLTIPCSDSYVDAVEEVILRRSWPPAHDRAWTTDDRALGIVADFLDLIGHHL